MKKLCYPLVGLMIVGALAACVKIDPVTGKPVTGVSSAPNTSTAGTPAVEPSTAASTQPSVSPTPAPTAAPISLKGTGQTASEKFTLEAGMSIFRLKHQGESSFSVWLLDAQGEKVDLLANDIGDFDGAAGLGIEQAGEFVLDVSADGPWSVSIEQPRPTTASALTSAAGSGRAVQGPFSWGGGLARFTLSHQGDANFSVWLLDSKGEKTELLVNEIGAFNGSKAVGVDAGIYYLDVTANGAWTVKME